MAMAGRGRRTLSRLRGQAMDDPQSALAASGLTLTWLRKS